ncbi:MAG: tetratricopeptide repeat protein [Acidobacteriota bacterium]|nr:tetratricopeptide repeat protein [Acidobacteriota bacterium]
MKTLLLTILLFASLPCSAQPNPADAVIQKAITAMGGIDRIHAIHSLIFRGFHYEGSYPQEAVQNRASNATMTRMRPNLRLVGCRPEIPQCNGQWGRIVESFDGQHGWELNWPKQRLVHSVNKAERAARCGAQFDPLFIDYKQRGFQAAYLGRKTVLGTESEAVQVDEQGCSSVIYYFHPKTYVLTMTEITVPIHARGDLIETVEVIKTAKMVNGVRIPSRTEEINLITGDTIDGSEITSIDANTLSDPAIFAAPTVHPVGITAVVLDMLKSADSAAPQQVMALYSAFRATPEGKQADTVYDMNWLGFELLKVDKYGQALAVFNQVIAENPTSATAYESLGEAYLQQGDKPNAIAALQKALDLGLKSEDVQRKLARIRSASPSP